MLLKIFMQRMQRKQSIIIMTLVLLTLINIFDDEYTDNLMFLILKNLQMKYKDPQNNQ